MSAKSATCPSDEILADYGLGKLDNAGSRDHPPAPGDLRRLPAVVASLSGDSFVNRLREAQAVVRPSLPAHSCPANRSPTPPKAPRRRVPASGEASTGAHSPALSNVPPELANHPDYEFLKELGRGGMGVVYLARNRMMDRLEVLKVVSKSLLDRPGALERFQQEIRSAAKLAHPNIVAAYSVLRPGDLLVFAMEYVDGQDLSQVVKQRGRAAGDQRHVLRPAGGAGVAARP